MNSIEELLNVYISMLREYKPRSESELEAMYPELKAFRELKDRLMSSIKLNYGTSIWIWQHAGCWKIGQKIYSIGNTDVMQANDGFYLVDSHSLERYNGNPNDSDNRTAEKADDDPRSPSV